MSHIRLRATQSTLGLLSAILLTVSFHFPGLANASSQISGALATTATSGVTVETSGCDLRFNPFALYDYGVQTSVALHSSGLALEFHRSANDHTIWYRVGKQNPLNENSIRWANSQRASGAYGYWPAVALSKEGYVIEVHSDREHKDGAQQFYRVGKIDPTGDETQSIVWKTEFINWDGGFHTSIAINDNGLIVGVHQINATSGTGLYYRVGQLKNPAGGDFTIAWSSGSKGVAYDDGVNPHIAINNHNQVVEVHQVTNESLLHYRRGTVSAVGKISFAESQRYDNDARQPAVALLDSGLVLEVHTWGGLYSRTGKLDPANSALIEWSAAVRNGEMESVEYPALATNGRYAFQTHEKIEIHSFSDEIYYSGAEIQCQDL
jgi:hypothetical protein